MEFLMLTVCWRWAKVTKYYLGASRRSWGFEWTINVWVKRFLKNVIFYRFGHCEIRSAQYVVRENFHPLPICMTLPARPLCTWRSLVQCTSGQRSQTCPTWVDGIPDPCHTCHPRIRGYSVHSQQSKHTGIDSATVHTFTRV